MTKTSAGAERRAAPAGEYISLVRIKSSDGGLRTLLLAVAAVSRHFFSDDAKHPPYLKIYDII